MNKVIDFYFDYGSPATYLAWTQIYKIVEEADANLNMIPMLLGGVFKETGNASPATVPAKSKWMGADLRMYAKNYNVEFNSNSFFPINTLNLMRGAIAAQKLDIFEKYSDTIFKGIWVKDLNLGDLEVLKDYLEKSGIPSDEVFKLCQDQEIKNELITNTQEAVSKGIFGAPSFIIDGILIFGQDRLHFVKDLLTN
tara:strand:- start:636 stop:1223 length:588 start_codon:yes stop_codon:yes gene_type:complete